MFVHATAKLTEILFRFILCRWRSRSRSLTLQLSSRQCYFSQILCWFYILLKLVISTQILPHYQKWLILFAVVMMTMQLGWKNIYKF